MKNSIKSSTANIMNIFSCSFGILAIVLYVITFKCVFSYELENSNTDVQFFASFFLAMVCTVIFLLTQKEVMKLKYGADKY